MFAYEVRVASNTGLSLSELLAAFDVVGCSSDRCVRHEVDGERADTALARRADDDVAVVAHVGNFVPACSATVYLAYQSGQSGSACPMRAWWFA
jgi:hypothetical protein